MKHHDWNQEEAGVWTRGETDLETNDRCILCHRKTYCPPLCRWHQLVFSGQGQPPPPPGVCWAAPLLCSLASQVYRGDQGQPPAAGTIKLSVLSGLSHLVKSIMALDLDYVPIPPLPLHSLGATHVKPHYGLTNTKLRAHLPLVVPRDPAPVLRVDQVTRHQITIESDS